MTAFFIIISSIATLALLKIAVELEKTREVLEDVAQELDELNAKAE